mmetsp:Transcript_20041/g.49233  ORF Transcript_20041/g.49233 Transcript_20041/m.49233 type:complete len:252 (-) Transcript_20041:778-1533(-)
MSFSVSSWSLFFLLSSSSRNFSARAAAMRAFPSFSLRSASISAASLRAARSSISRSRIAACSSSDGPSRSFRASRARRSSSRRPIGLSFFSADACACALRYPPLSGEPSPRALLCADEAREEGREVTPMAVPVTMPRLSGEASCCSIRSRRLASSMGVSCTTASPSSSSSAWARRGGRMENFTTIDPLSNPLTWIMSRGIPSARATSSMKSWVNLSRSAGSEMSSKARSSRRSTSAASISARSSSLGGAMS